MILSPAVGLGGDFVLFQDCDAIVVNYNAGRFLVDCIRSLLENRVSRVIVVDNNSTDASLDGLVNAVSNEKLLVIRNSENLGFAAACNIGARASSAKHLLFLNPDCVLEAGSLERMLRALDESPKVGMVGGFLSNMDGSEQPGARRVFPTPGRAFMRAFGLSWLGRFFPETLSDFLLYKTPVPTKAVPVEAISGACMLVKREALDSVGLWDEGYFLHCEDLDWCMRFWQKGWTVMFVPDAKVFHVWGACSRNRPFFVEWHKHHGMLRFYRKFYRQQYSGVFWGFVVVGVWFRFGLVSSYYAAKLALNKLGVGRGV